MRITSWSRSSGKGEEEIALTLRPGVIHDHDVAVSALAGPCVGNEAVGAPVAWPCRQWLKRGPSAVPKGVRVLRRQQEHCASTFSDLHVGWLNRGATKMSRHPDPPALKLALMEEA